MNIGNVLKHPNMLMAAIWARVGGNVSDETYLKWRYRFIFGKKLNLENPKGFNEKINWLKIYNRNPLYPRLVDKAEVKKIVAEQIGEEHIIPTYGVWNRFEDIDFDSLPNQFVLKSTNGGGGSGVVICRDKKAFDKENAKRKLELSMRTNWRFEREWVYRDVKPRIIAERLMINNNVSTDLPDYKFFCFNGEPLYCQVIRDRSKEETIDFYDMEWKLMPFNGINTIERQYRNGPTPIPKPLNIEEMRDICKKLAKDIPFVRVDLYNIEEKSYFGELTFYPAGGMGTFSPSKYEEIIGDLLRLEPLSGGGRFNISIRNDGEISIEPFDDNLVDWKIFCFNGDPKVLFYASDRYTKGEPLKFDWYDMDLNHLPIKSHGIPQANKELKMFPEWEEMKETARKLSQGFPHVRVDLYLINHKVYFGELTFFHDGGVVALEPEEWEYTLGSWIDLPEKKIEK